MKTVYDIIVFKPERTVVVCTWRSDYANDLLDEMTRLHCPDATNRWMGMAMWRETETIKEK